MSEYQVEVSTTTKTRMTIKVLDSCCSHGCEGNAFNKYYCDVFQKDLTTYNKASAPLQNRCKDCIKFVTNGNITIKSGKNVTIECRGL